MKPECVVKCLVATCGELQEGEIENEICMHRSNSLPMEMTDLKNE